VGARFSAPRPDRRQGPPNLLYNGYQLSFPGIKRPGRGVNHPALSSAEVKESVELYICSLWAFMACSRMNFIFCLVYILPTYFLQIHLNILSTPWSSMRCLSFRHSDDRNCVSNSNISLGLNFLLGLCNRLYTL
jgi:hypothetical protein